jgi:hypothetical protein
MQAALVAVHQLGWAHVEGVGDPQQVGEAHVALAALDAADVRAMKAAANREDLLRYAAREPQLPDRQSERCVL